MKYGFVITQTISLVTEVEAETLEAAMEIAASRGIMGMCHACQGGDSNVEWGTEIDCEVSGSKLIDVYTDKLSLSDNKAKMKRAAKAWGEMV